MRKIKRNQEKQQKQQSVPSLIAKEINNELTDDNVVGKVIQDKYRTKAPFKVNTGMSGSGFRETTALEHIGDIKFVATRDKSRFLELVGSDEEDKSDNKGFLEKKIKEYGTDELTLIACFQEDRGRISYIYVPNTEAITGYIVNIPYTGLQNQLAQLVVEV